MTAAAPQEAQSPQVPPIRNFLKINDQFCTGGQPRMEHLDQLKADGVKAIINLRTPGEHRADEEEAKAKELGLRYFNIPVVFRDPKPEQVDEFLKLTDDPANRPAFIHCTAAIRVGAFWMVRRVMRDGWTGREGRRGGQTGWPAGEPASQRVRPEVCRGAQEVRFEEILKKGSNLPGRFRRLDAWRSLDEDDRARLAPVDVHAGRGGGAAAEAVRAHGRRAARAAPRTRSKRPRR